ncbi:MAG: hypothetical protein ACLR7U_10110 [Ruthenibacterium lactatiformans]
MMRLALAEASRCVEVLRRGGKDGEPVAVVTTRGRPAMPRSAELLAIDAQPRWAAAAW